MGSWFFGEGLGAVALGSATAVGVILGDAAEAAALTD